MLLTSELLQVGYTPHTIAAAVRRGLLIKVRRGAYRYPGELTPERLHEVLIRATLAQASNPHVVSHTSAAVLHGLPVDRRRLDQVHLVQEGERSRSASGGPVVRHQAKWVEATTVEGIDVTTIESTVVDLARRLPFGDGVALADAALAQGISRTALAEVVRSQPGCHGNAAALSVIAFADPRSESAGESHTRAAIRLAGQEVPDLQAVFHDDEGEMRTDFWWRERNLVGEFDGKVKYGRDQRHGHSLDEVMHRERRREIRLRRLGQETIRFCWADVLSIDAVARIVSQGFALTQRRS